MNRNQAIAVCADKIRKTGAHYLAIASYAYTKYFLFDRFKKPSVEIKRAPESKKVAIFAIYQLRGMSSFCRKQLLYLRKLGYDVVLVAPHAIAPQDREFVDAHCRIVVTRQNFGRDMGSYRDGVVAVGRDEYAQYERVLMLNDSIYFPVGDTARFESEFVDSTDDVVGLCENVQYTAHIGSYFIEFSKRLFCGDGMQKFWEDFKPLDSRIHSIDVGEYGISRVAYKEAASIKILYSAERILGDLSKMDVSTYWPHMSMIVGDDFRDVKYKLADAGVGANVLDSTEDSGKPKIDLEHFAVRSTIESAIRQKLTSSSPPHTFGLPILHLFGAPFMKRDLYYRMLVDLLHVQTALQTVETPEVVREIILDLRKKGTHIGLSTKDLFKYHIGII